MNILTGSIALIKRATGASANVQLKYVLRSVTDVTVLLGRRKADELNRIDEDAAEYKFQTRAISLSDYFALKSSYSKDLAEIAAQYNKDISKFDLLKLYQLNGTAGHTQFELLLLQKLSQFIGDLSLEEIVCCLENLKVYEKKVTAFQFQVLSERILELSHLITSQSLVRIIYLFGKFDAGTDELWDTLAKLFLFRIQDFSKQEVLSALRGFAGVNRGTDAFWEQVSRTYVCRKCIDLAEEKVDFELIWVLMRVETKSPEFWLLVNRNFEKLLLHSREGIERTHNISRFYKFFKYSIVNILNISKVNQIELVDALVAEKQHFDSEKAMKLLKLLAKHKMLSQKLVDAFQSDASIMLLPGANEDHSF